MTRNPRLKWRHYAPDSILLCVRWYCRYQLSCRDIEETMRERGPSVDHVTIFRWVQRHAHEINEKMRPHLKMSGAPIPSRRDVRQGRQGVEGPV